jgi:hypothetical protein
MSTTPTGSDNPFNWDTSTGDSSVVVPDRFDTGDWADSVQATSDPNQEADAANQTMVAAGPVAAVSTETKMLAAGGLGLLLLLLVMAGWSA